MTNKTVVYKYGTGNPVEPNGSGDVRDGIDNLQSFDVFMNADEDTYNQRDGQIVQTAIGAIRSIGFKPGAGDFTTGFTVMPGQRDYAWYDPVSKNWYSWLGGIPVSGYVVAPGTNPVGDVNWKPVTDQLLRNDLIAGFDGIYSRNTTVTETATGLFDIGVRLRLTDRGGATATVQSGGVANGETILNAGPGRTAVIDAKYYGDAETYSSLQAALNSVKALGIKVLNINSDITVGSDPSNKGAAAFIGNGRVTGAYRKRVAKVTDPESVAFNDLNPETHLKRFLGKTNPVVVVVGDSLATDAGANIPTIDTLYGRLKTKIAAAYPDKTITFYNRAIGGETYFSAVALPSSFPTWYTNQTRSWPLYVGDLSPDLVIFSFGMNDSSNLHTNKLVEYQGYLDNTGIFPAGRPDVIYCTNFTPALDTTFASLGSQANQSGRDLVAGYTRSFARNIGAGLLDFHRQCTIVKDGYDPTDTYLELVGAITPSSGAVTATNYPCQDFKWDLTLTLAVGTNMAIRLGAPSDPAIDPVGRGSYAVVYNNAGNLKVDFFTADVVSDAVIYASFTTTTPVPAGSFVLTVEKRQNSATFSIGGTTAVSFDKLRVAGSDVPPRAGNASYAAGPITAAQLWVGRYKTYKQTVINDDMWGTSDNAAVQRQPFGGNGANHPSSIGSAAVYQPVLDNADFSGAGDLTGSLTLMNSWRTVPGKMPSAAFRSGKFVCISFSVQVPVTGTPAKGIVANVPVGFRPTVSAYALLQTNNAAAGTVQCDVQSNGNIEIYNNVDAFAWGTITFVLP